ncbi:MAG: hypothetical protein AVDCRST_MAG49-716 [uncultured Thermomicrobiales bacterium]|uniref:Uncharacterized protein n=1 Tax=uncultured Thermomicrobiales bacterium TaxID=1645740 RepID=A0A6J4U3G7_9BACT|nr:MAG: hypothetical protein AVDCRST_MAG49-716 [uncultured Thermomicrobiales bacterium]
MRARRVPGGAVRDAAAGGCGLRADRRGAGAAAGDSHGRDGGRGLAGTAVAAGLSRGWVRWSSATPGGVVGRGRPTGSDA